MHEHVEALQLGGHIGPKATKFDPVRDAEAVGQGVQLGLMVILAEERRAHDGRRNVPIGEGAGKSLEEHGLAFPGRQPADHAHALDLLPDGPVGKGGHRVGDHGGAPGRRMWHRGKRGLGVGHERGRQQTHRPAHE